MSSDDSDVFTNMVPNEPSKHTCAFVLGFINSSGNNRELNAVVGKDVEQCSILYAFHEMIKAVFTSE